MNPLAYVIIACSGLLVSCAATLPPQELLDARQACSHASASPATQRVPAELSKARKTLARAEKSFRDSPTSARTRALANLAYREAREAEVLAARTIGGATHVIQTDNAK